MNKFCINIFIAVLLPIFSFAQAHYKPGYIVTSNGDTLRGQIDYKAWDINPVNIRFRPEGTTGEKRFNINDIDFFSIGKIAAFKKYTGSISMNDISIVHMENFRDTSAVVKTVFLKILVIGKNLYLYSYSDDIKTRYFISEAPSHYPVELVYRLYYDLSAVTAIKGRTVNENTYMQQLFALAIKYNVSSDKLQRDIENSSYEQSNIEDIVKQINK